MAEVTKPVALNESLNTTDSTPKNIADVLKDKLGDIASAISGGGGGSGGHTIQNASGANMPQETTMQFKDSHVTDNSQAGKTEVEVIKSVASADYPSETEDGLYLLPDGDGSVIEPASEDYVEVTADGVKTYAQLLTELKELIDKTKLQYYSEIVLDKQTSVEIHDIVYWDANVVATACVFTTYGGVTETDTFYIGNNVKYQKNIVGNVTDMSSEKPSNGTKITLYYGNKKAVVDLQTTANRCLMSDGTTTVQAKFDGLFKTKTVSGTTDSNGLISLGLSSPNVVISAYDSTQGNKIIPYDYSGAWKAMVCDVSGTSVITRANLSVHIDVIYI